MTRFPSVRLLGCALAAFAVCGCSLGDEPKTFRGQVVDQDTGKGIPGAIVVAMYQGGVSFGGGSCNRMESAVSDADGWYEFPIDRKAGSIFTEAYHREYGLGKRNRKAQPMDASLREWQVVIYRWDAENQHATEVGKEPKIYRSREAAQAASGEETNTYLRRFNGSPSERLVEIRRLARSCAGGAKTTPGGVPFLEAVLREQIELGAGEDTLGVTRRAIQIMVDADRKARESAK